MAIARLLDEVEYLLYISVSDSDVQQVHLIHENEGVMSFHQFLELVTFFLFAMAIHSETSLLFRSYDQIAW